jgi:integrase
VIKSLFGICLTMWIRVGKDARSPSVMQTSAKRKIRVFTDDECHNLCKAARQYEENGSPVRWELLIRLCLGTGMRRGELMNAPRASVSTSVRTGSEFLWRS